MKKSKYNQGKILFAGQCYYNTWYLSRELRKLGWQADVLDFDPNPDSTKYYHGFDFKFTYSPAIIYLFKQLAFYITSIIKYDIFHFSGAHALSFGNLISSLIRRLHLPAYTEIKLLKKLRKKIVYSNNGCLDGVSQSSFRSWEGPEPVCDICPWRDKPEICCDNRNLSWGKIRNSLADYQVTLGGNRKDYNDDLKVHEVPEFYCLDPDFWNPSLPVPDSYRLNFPPGTVKLYHAVGNFKLRTELSSNRNLKSTHIYLPLIERLKAEGYPVELIFATDIPNKQVRYYQLQADIVLEMLTFGFFGSNAREAMMLGKPVICYLRPSWLESMRKEIPQYVNELPIVTATPNTVYNILVDLINNKEKRLQIGQRSREFALKWHSARAGAQRMDKIYSDLLHTKM